MTRDKHRSRRMRVTRLRSRNRQSTNLLGKGTGGGDTGVLRADENGLDSGLFDIHNLVTASKTALNDTSDSLIMLGSLLCPPVLTAERRVLGTGAKVGIVAGVLASLVLIVVAVVAVLHTGERPSLAASIDTAGLSLLASRVSDVEQDPVVAEEEPQMQGGNPVEIEAPPRQEAIEKKSSVQSKRHRSRSARSSKKSSGKSRSALPGRLTRSQVQAGLGAVRRSVKRCGRGKKGPLLVNVVISRKGRVTSARPARPFAGTSVGKCATRAIRRARFPKFNGPRMRVRYPFTL